MGAAVGLQVGELEGATEGTTDGVIVGLQVGTQDGTIVGKIVGRAEGDKEGFAVGINEGSSDGEMVGATVGVPGYIARTRYPDNSLTYMVLVVVSDRLAGFGMPADDAAPPLPELVLDPVPANVDTNVVLPVRTSTRCDPQSDM